MGRRPIASAVSHGGAPAGWLDAGVNLNPLGVPEPVGRALTAVRFDRYADLDPSAAERHLAADAGVAPSRVVLTAGASEALRLITTAVLRPGVRALIAGPTYGEYGRLAARQGAEVVELRAMAPAFGPPIDALERELRRPGPAVAFLCDPNNPTGRALAREDLRRLVAAAGRPHGRHRLLVIDQSFGSFACSRVPARELVATGHVVLVRSLTKLLASPGIRVGYLIGAPRLLDQFRAIRDPWPVGSHAIAAASAATWRLGPADRWTIRGWRRALAAGLRWRGMRPIPSAANFLLAEVGPEAGALVAAAARRRVGLRWCASFGLPEHIRVAVRPPAEQALLFEALDAVLPSLMGRPAGSGADARHSIAAGLAPDTSGSPAAARWP